MHKIDKKIVGYKVIKEDKPEVEQPKENSTEKSIETVKAVVIHEKVERKEILHGCTYKIKPSNSEHSYYITINSIDIDGKLFPFELFINSKGIEYIRLKGLSRLISAIFRKGGDTHFIIDELKAIYDPVGSYTSKRCYSNGKRKRFNSLEAEIGDIIEEHLEVLEAKNKSMTMEEIKEKFVEKVIEEIVVPKIVDEVKGKKCPECGNNSLVMLDGCMTCLDCAWSKCN